MRITRFRVAFAALAAGAVALSLWWPRISEVETGKTEDYPDLQPRKYSRPAAVVAKAVERAMKRSGRYSITGGGSGPSGYATAATAVTPVLRSTSDFSVAVKPEGQGSRVNVRSRSRTLAWDFGENARTVRQFLSALDAEVNGPPDAGVN